MTHKSKIPISVLTTYTSMWKWNSKQQESGPYEISSNPVSVSNSI